MIVWGAGIRDSYSISAEKAMAPHSSPLAWKIPWTEEPGRLQSMGSQRVRHDWATSLSLFTFMHWRRKWQPTPVFLPGESQGRRSLAYGVAQSRTRLKWLSSSTAWVKQEVSCYKRNAPYFFQGQQKWHQVTSSIWTFRKVWLTDVWQNWWNI